MSNFRDAVAQVQEHAARGDLHALEVILNDFDAERAARLVAANALGRAGESGHQILLVTVMFSDTLGKFAALRAYLLHQAQLDEELLLQAIHSKHTRVRRGMKRLLRKLPFPVSDELRLRCYLPEPYCYDRNVTEKFGEWLNDYDYPWYMLLDAISTARYEPALPQLVEALKGGSNRSYRLIGTIADFGDTALPYLQAALPDSVGQERIAILQVMWRITYPDIPFPERPSPALAELDAWFNTELSLAVPPRRSVYKAPPPSPRPLPVSSAPIPQPDSPQTPAPVPAPVSRPSGFAALIARVKRFLSE